VDTSKLTPGAIVILASALVMLVASFLDLYNAPEGFEGSLNAWDEGQFAIVTLVVLLAVAAAAIVALLVFGGMELSDRILSLTWNQVLIALGFQTTIMMIATFLRDYDPAERGVGLFLMMLAAIGLLVGAILRAREAASPAADPGTQPPPL
jgi:hypothetical protein